MTVFRFKLMVLLLLCACSSGFAADEGALGLKPGESGLRLKLQPLLIPIPPDNRDPVPLFVDADNLQGQPEQEIEAEGSVRLRRRGQAVYADWLRYDKPEDEVNARGNVRLEQRGDVLEGDKLRLNLETERGAIDQSRYQVQVKNTSGRGEAERIQLEGEGKYRLQNGSYTSCEVGNNDWFVRARELQIDKERDLGIARDASIEFLGQTIFYTPYLSFSLDDQRKSGFLTPSVGRSNNSGVIVGLPYYWNIAPNRDATITPRELSKRGLQLDSEFRYLENNYFGEAHVEYLSSDRAKNDDNRYALAFRHNQQWDNGWRGSLNILKVSDDRYFTDLSTQIAVTSQSVLPRAGSLEKNGTWWNGGAWGVSALVQRWQTLQTDPLKPLTPPYNRAQLALTATKQGIGPADLEVISNFVDFNHPTLVNGKRAVAYPSLSLPLQSSFAYLIPKVGVNYTHYDLDPTTTARGDQNRTVPIFSAETGLVFERPTTFGQNLTQTLEPKVYYVYTPTRQQNQIPNFDSAVRDVSFATLYAENQFSGYDRINDANQVTVGVTSRFLHPESGLERLRIGLAQRYYFKSQEVTLPGVAPRGSNSSDLLAAVSGRVAQDWSLDAGWQYTTDVSQTQKLNVGAHYQPEPGKVLNVSYRYTNGALLTANQVQTPGTTVQNNTLRQIDISTQWPVSGRWTGIGRWNYSLFDNKLVEGLAGFEYNGDCWAFRVVGHRFATATQEQVSSVFLQLELNGLSKIGSNPLEMLRRSISGYYRQDAQPVRSDAVFPGY